MDANVITQAITTVGFPIVACGAMAYYVKYVEDKHREERANADTLHNTEMSKIADTVNNNTIALTKLCEKMDK